MLGSSLTCDIPMIVEPPASGTLPCAVVGIADCWACVARKVSEVLATSGIQRAYSVVIIEAHGYGANATHQ